MKDFHQELTEELIDNTYDGEPNAVKDDMVRRSGLMHT
jgi:hypothetical protein